MKITPQEILDGKEWLHSEILESLNGEIIAEAREIGFYKIKLLVNGHELEPKLFNHLMDNLEKYIQEEAKSLIREKLEEAEGKANELVRLVESAKRKIMNDHNLDETDF